MTHGHGLSGGLAARAQDEQVLVPCEEGRDALRLRDREGRLARAQQPLHLLPVVACAARDGWRRGEWRGGRHGTQCARACRTRLLRRACHTRAATGAPRRRRRRAFGARRRAVRRGGRRRSMPVSATRASWSSSWSTVVAATSRARGAGGGSRFGRRRRVPPRRLLCKGHSAACGDSRRARLSVCVTVCTVGARGAGWQVEGARRRGGRGLGRGRERRRLARRPR
jgi:hypothetical protein